jgi:hypothetical protein
MKKPTNQPSLFKQTIPQMPAGYYSPGPNPNLRQFITDHAAPYDSDYSNHHMPNHSLPIPLADNQFHWQTTTAI